MACEARSTNSVPLAATQSADAANYNFVQQRAPLTGIFRINLTY